MHLASSAFFLYEVKLVSGESKFSYPVRAVGSS
jgi:hypothetical protein